MKKLTILPLLLAMMYLLPACKSKQEVASPSPEVIPASKCAQILKGTAVQKDPIAGLDAKIANNCLQLKLQYSGGCKEHHFDLYWTGDWMKSKPAVAQVYLSHNSNEDNCEAVKSEMLEVDLLPLRPDKSGQILIEINAEGVPMKRISYTY